MAAAEVETPEIELRERGLLTLPKSLRDALRLEPGEMLRAAKVGNAIILTPQRMDLDALRQQMRRLMKKHGVTAEDLLRDLWSRSSSTAMSSSPP
jgi:bifunctional DNA-binding transcriptional regulator/antitoxin component of YhaV-PrlF toxin-antitoxin module